MKNVLAVALVVSVASIALSQAPAPKPADVPAAEHSQKWEYKVSSRGGNRDAGASVAAYEKTLNDAAKDGWELFTINEDKFLIFRRPFLRPLVDRGPAQPATGQPPTEDPNEDM